MQRSFLTILFFVFIALAAIPASASLFSWWNDDEEQNESVSQPVEVPDVALPDTVAAPQLPHNYPRQPVIAVIIDDMGVDLKRSARAIELPAGVTLSFLPYARHLAEQTEKATSKGHFLMLHIPMQPIDPHENAGPNVLTVGEGNKKLDAAIETNLNSFEGYMAVNNHMGSKFTQVENGMRHVMAELKKRHLLFVDSRTSPKSVAVKAAREEGVTVISRDVFIDHVEDAAHVENALKETEQKAFKKGYAVAIGHPKDLTLSALEKWLPTLKDKGIALVPVTNIPVDQK